MKVWSCHHTVISNKGYEQPQMCNEVTHLATHLVWPHQPENPPARPRAWRISP